jgi:hypothetical protein
VATVFVPMFFTVFARRQKMGDEAEAKTKTVAAPGHPPAPQEAD